MGHADHHILDAVAAAAADQRVHQRNQRIAAFQREALLADVLGVQVAFEAFGGGQPLEDAQLGRSVEAEAAGGAFEPLLHPAPLGGVGDVHELGADAAAVGGLEPVQQVAKLEFVGPEIGGDAELAIQVGRAQAVEFQAQVRGLLRRRHGQRVERRAQVAARAVGGDQLSERGLLPGGFLVDAGSAAAGELRRGLNLRHHGRMRQVARFTALEARRSRSSTGRRRCRDRPDTARTGLR